MTDNSQKSKKNRRQTQAGRFDLEPAGFKWYREDSNGDVHISLLKNPTPGYGSNLSVATRAALALNQVCCRNMTGMFYVLHHPPYEPRQHATQAEYESFAVVKLVPELLYIPEGWTSDSKEQFEKMTPLEQAHRMWAPLGWIRDEAVVLPISVAIFDVQMQHLRLTGATTAPCTVLFTPRPFVGPTADLRELCEPVFRTNTEGQVNRIFYDAKDRGYAGWAKFRRWQIDGIDGVVEAVDRMYRTKAHLTMSYGRMFDLLEESQRKARGVKAD